MCALETKKMMCLDLSSTVVPCWITDEDESMFRREKTHDFIIVFLVILFLFSGKTCFSNTKTYFTFKQIQLPKDYFHS